jgi:hypothetical protein
MEDLVPLLKKQAQGEEISGLAAYEVWTRIYGIEGL